MAAAKKPTATETEKEVAENSPVITSEGAKSEPKLVSVMNVSPYGKVNPTNKAVYVPNQIVKDVKLDNWVETQIKAKILKVVE